MILQGLQSARGRSRTCDLFLRRDRTVAGARWEWLALARSSVALRLGLGGARKGSRDASPPVRPPVLPPPPRRRLARVAGRLRRVLTALIDPGSGLDLIAAERQRQLADEDFSDAHDDLHVAGELAMAAACYAAPRFIYVGRATPAGIAVAVDPWPFLRYWDKRITNRAGLDTPPTAEGRDARLRELAKAGALVAAEIDRLQRITYPRDGR